MGLAEEPTANSTCVLHASFGERYVSKIDAFSVPNKTAYANRHGYAFKYYWGHTWEDLLEGNFSGCQLGNRTNALKQHSYTIAKFCAVQMAFADGCRNVLWTDSNAIILKPELTIEAWLAQSQSPDADVHWAISDFRPRHFCYFPGEQQNTSNGCINLATFVGCLNSGAFIIRQTSWSNEYILHLLQRAVGHDDCGSTKNVSIHRREQCGMGAADDQCLISCETIGDPDILNHYACFSKPAKTVFQVVQPEWYQLLLSRIRDAFVVNCADGGESCLRRIFTSDWDAEVEEETVYLPGGQPVYDFDQTLSDMR